MIQTELNKKLVEYKQELDSTGCGFCLAKWTQVTIHLQMGETHSCHHPKTHKIPISEIGRNPSALHNTRYKKRLRKEMLEGKRPEECEYCWNVEDNSNELSDRVYKSNEPWSKDHLEEIRNSHWRTDFNPRYVEVSFANTCNFKCSYCGPSFSSTWVKEIEKFGGYPTDDNFNDIQWLKDQGKMPIPHNEHNPYVEAFWEWWPELYRDLHTFRITGGEPLLAKDTWKVLDYIIEQDNPNTNLNLAINSNLGVPTELVDRLIKKVKILEERNLVKTFVLYTSVDTFGSHAEYLRNGLDFNKWRNHFETFLDSTSKSAAVIMSTFNALSIPRYKELLEYVWNLKKKHNSEDRYWPFSILLDSSYLRYPSHQTVQILPDEFAEKVDALARYAQTKRNIVEWEPGMNWKEHYAGFTDIEIGKLQRIADWMRSTKDESRIKSQKKNFYRFFAEHDRRRGTDFTTTFPELTEFYNHCKDLVEKE